VLSGIDVSDSIIAVADTGIDMNNCFFYDDAVSMPPYNNSRVVQSYTVFPCEVCGRCCGSQSGANCSNSTNACGDYIDQTAHGTHVVGTIAGAGPGNVTYGNGISNGAKIFFQDFEKLLNDSQCYAPGMCSRGISRPTDLFNLFSPAYQAGARVHSNSWGTVGNYQYNQESRATDSFTADNPTFIVLFCRG
jgi:subtilisin family serine protease